MSESRNELEARLQAATDSMSRRIASIEDEVKLPTAAEVAESLPAGMVRKVGVAIGVGLVVGLVAGGFGKRARRAGRRDWTEKLADMVHRLVKEGRDPEEAVRKAVEKVPPPEAEGGGPGGLVSFVLGYAVRQGTSTLVREIVNRVASRNGQEKG